MGKPVAGDVVIVPFPFSNLTDTKRRPALVLASLDGNDVVLCMITSQSIHDRYAIPLAAQDFASGSLPVASNIRPSRIFTADAGIIVRVVGRLREEKLSQVRKSLTQLLTESDQP